MSDKYKTKEQLLKAFDCHIPRDLLTLDDDHTTIIPADSSQLYEYLQLLEKIPVDSIHTWISRLDTTSIPYDISEFRKIASPLFVWKSQWFDYDLISSLWVDTIKSYMTTMISYCLSYVKTYDHQTQTYQNEIQTYEDKLYDEIDKTQKNSLDQKIQQLSEKIKIRQQNRYKVLIKSLLEPDATTKLWKKWKKVLDTMVEEIQKQHNVGQTQHDTTMAYTKRTLLLITLLILLLFLLKKALPRIQEDLKNRSKK
jgi:hypothetical protein